jgi:protein MpaA
MSMRRKRLSTLVMLVWGLNIFAVLAVFIVVMIYLSRQSALASPLDATASPFPTVTAFPTRFNLPTVTPNPSSTEIVFLTPTPFVLLNGPDPIVIGFSVGKRPLEVYAFGNGDKHRMIVAGIHGGYESNTTALADQLILYLNDHPEAIPKDVTLYILRDLNPDGNARGNSIEGRVNDHGVDLNRNFPINWSATWDRSGCYDQSPTTSGTGPASEPETLAVINFLAYRRIEALISYHSAALGIFPGGSPWDTASIHLAQKIAEVSNYPYPPVETGCVYTGTLADYAVSRGIAAVDMELSDHESTDYRVNLKVLKILLEFVR